MSGTVDVTVKARAKCPAETAFDVIAPIDLSSILEGWLLVPGVDGVRDQTGAWDAAGQTRTVLLSDGSEVEETLTSVERPKSFGYRVGPLPGPLGLLAGFATGEWVFKPVSAKSTDISWTYSFEVDLIRHMAVRLIVAPMWRGYADRALKRAVAAAEAAHKPAKKAKARRV